MITVQLKLGARLRVKVSDLLETESASTSVRSRAIRETPSHTKIKVKGDEEDSIT